MKIKYIIFLLLCSFTSFSQDILRGMVMIKDQGQIKGVSGATVYWSDTDIGISTDLEGWFEIPYKKEYKKLVISYIGYQTDTLMIDSNLKEIHHLLSEDNTLEEVTVEATRKGTYLSTKATMNETKITSQELLKAACCNLSESFSTNPSIDVNFSDAITGTKQINMLGLTSPYILIAQENIPTIRGASQAYGLTYTPGTWLESIQITKGAGSVVNGYESIAGQINTELVKPATDVPLFVNVYGANTGRLELNTHVNQQVSEKWSTGLYVHGNTRVREVDQNDDGFLDLPLGNQINLMNRWQYQDLQKGWVAFVDVKFLNDEKQSGQVSFNPDTDKLTNNAWGSEVSTNRFEMSSKLGYVFPDQPYKSFGIQLNYSNHNQDSYYGLRTYDIHQQSYYTNWVYNSIIGDTRSKFKTGLNATLDQYDEFVENVDWSRNDNSFGAFFEYSYDNLDNFSLTAGIRVDQHNQMGFFVTPRLHTRFVPWENGVWRASAGRGQRLANIFAENQQLFASNRQVYIQNSGEGVYGLNPEVAWNYGTSFLQEFKLFGRQGEVVFDFYRTIFENQVVVDWETPQQVNFYNLEGTSYSNSYQIELGYNLVKRLNFKASYKYHDVQIDYQSARKIKPLSPQHRFFANLDYKTKDFGKGYWKFDLTYNWVGEQRLPDTSSNPIQYQRPEFSPTTDFVNAQITRVFSNQFEVYLGGENIFNTVQDNPIISSEDPFGNYFDSTIVYAPINGANYYLGLRFKLL